MYRFAVIFVKKFYIIYEVYPVFEIYMHLWSFL
jgi:hypothetical protein